MIRYMEPIQAGGKLVEIFYDDLHETRGSYGYDEEETKAAEDLEIEKLNSGEWVVLFVQISDPCTNPTHCSDCSKWVFSDSCGGFVVENNEPRVLEVIAWDMGIPELREVKA